MQDIGQTPSPGISLKQEGITYIAGAELPCLVVDVMRGGPGLGTIQPSQSDYFQATKGGGHGDYHLIVLAPASVQEMSDFVVLGFELAFKYRNPAMVLADGVIGQMMEKVVLPDYTPRWTDEEIEKISGDWALTGKKKNRNHHIITSLELEAHRQEVFNELTKKYEIPTDVSLNTIMVDGTGMCGACRITVGGKTKFVCVDGPEFDGHQVNFDEMLKRMGAFKNIEREEMHKLQPECEATKEIDEKSRNAAWRQELRKSMKPKERTAIPRVEMNELDAEYRSHSRKEEVNQGLTAEQAVTEAKRCLDCANPGCMEGCPVGIDIPRFIKNIERGEFLEAAKTLKETSALPAVCGRVCPQEKQCESKCIHLKMNEKPVAIGYLERFAADYERESGQISVPVIAEKNGIKIAVIGSGPAGLAFAGDMAKYGYDVTVFEALHEIGGVLKYGIPEFRLPNKIVDVEIDNLSKMGVNYIKECIVGKTIGVEDLKAEGFKGIFVASGAGLPNFMNIPGENSINIMSSNEYLTRVNLMDAASEDSDTPVSFGKNVAVIGGGNTAMDSVRTAKRLGAERAIIIYRRSEEEMPARIEEVKHAKEEGVEFLTLHNPIEYIADEQGCVKQVILQKMELGEPDASGRRSPVAIQGATETIDIDLAIVSVGVSPNPIVPSSIKGLELGRKGTITVDDNMESSIPMIYAGGDIVRGGATVILAMGDGRKAAAAMNEQLKANAGN